MSIRRRFLVVAALALGGCSTGAVEIFEQCSVAVNLDTTTAKVGESVTAEGGPFGESWDNAIEVDGTLATVIAVDQTERLMASGEPYEADACNRCNTCRDNNPGHCNRCRSICGACTETLTFEVPDVAPGSRSLVLRNRWGSSDRLSFLVEDSSSGTGSTTGGTGNPTSTGGTGTASPTGGTGSPTTTGGTGTQTATGGTGTSTGGTGTSPTTGGTGTLVSTGGTGAVSPTGGTGAAVSGTGGTGP